MKFSAREGALIGVLLLLLVVFGLIFGLRSYANWRENLERQIAQRQIVLQRLTALAQEQNLLNNTAHRAPQPSLIGYLEARASQSQLQQRIRLNQLDLGQNAVYQAVEVLVDQLTLDETVFLIRAIEQADVPLAIEQLEISRSFRDTKLLRMSLRVLALR